MSDRTGRRSELVPGERVGQHTTRARCFTDAGVVYPMNTGVAASMTAPVTYAGTEATGRVRSRLRRGTRPENPRGDMCGTDPWPVLEAGHVRERAFSDVSGPSRIAPRHRDTSPNGSCGTPLERAPRSPCSAPQACRRGSADFERSLQQQL